MFKPDFTMLTVLEAEGFEYIYDRHNSLPGFVYYNLVAT